MRAWIIGLCGFWGGCSLMGLDDDLEQSSCTGEPAEFCGALNDLEPTGDACLAWTCGPAGVCEILPRDEDGDFAPAAECAPEGTEPDCDDENDRRAPGLAETCDAIDNDCDATVDEEVALVAAAPSLVAPVSDVAKHPSYASSGVNERVIVTYTDGDITSTAGAAMLADLPGPDTVATRNSQLQLSEGSVDLGQPAVRAQAVAAQDADRIAAAQITSGTCAGVVVGALETDRATLQFPNGHYGPGLATPAGTCDDADLESGWLNAATLGNDVLVTWIARREEIGDDCMPFAPTDVLVSTGRFRQGELEPASGVASVAGPTTEATPPALLSVTDFGFLLARANGNQIDVQAVSIADAATGALSVSTPIASIDTGPEGRPGDLTLALATLEEGQPAETVLEVALAYRTNCSQPRVAVQLFTLDAAEGRLSPIGEPVEIEATQPERRPAVVYRRDLNRWLLAREQNNARIVLDDLTRVGTRVAGPPTVALDGLGPLRQNFYLRTLPEDDRFGLLAFVEATEASDRGFYGTRLSCE